MAPASEPGASSRFRQTPPGGRRATTVQPVSKTSTTVHARLLFSARIQSFRPVIAQQSLPRTSCFSDPPSCCRPSETRSTSVYVPHSVIASASQKAGLRADALSSVETHGGGAEALPSVRKASYAQECPDEDAEGACARLDRMDMSDADLSCRIANTLILVITPSLRRASPRRTKWALRSLTPRSMEMASQQTTCTDHQCYLLQYPTCVSAGAPVTICVPHELCCQPVKGKPSRRA